MHSPVDVAAKILPVLLLMGFGSYLRHIGFLDERAVSGIKRLVAGVTLPSLLFLAFSEVRFEVRYAVVVVTMFAVCALMLGVGKLFARVLKVSSPYFGLVFAGFEAGMLGYSVFTAVFGVENVYKFAVVDLGQVLFVFFILVSYLVKLRDGTDDYGALARSFVRSPVIVAIFLGILAGSTGAAQVLRVGSLGGSMFETVRLLSTLTVPLIVLVIGYELRINRRYLRLPLIAILARLAVLIVLGVLVSRVIISGLLGLDRGFELAVLTMFVLPPPFVMPLYMKDGDEENRQFILNTLSTHSLVTLVAFIVVMAVAM